MGRKWFYIIVAAVLVVILAVGGTVYYSDSNSYAAKVDGEKITKAEYQFFLSSVKSQLASMGVTDMKQKVDNKTAEEVVREGALEQAANYKIQLIKARENNVVFTSEERESFETGFENDVIKQAGGSKLEADKRIKEEMGISLEEYKEIYMGYFLTQKFVVEEGKKAKVSDDDIKKFYEENKGNIDTATVRHILFMTVDANNNPLSDDKIKEVEKKASDTLAKADGGADFAALARELSEDPGSKDNGGAYTIKKNGQMVKEFEDWTFNAKVGETGIIKTMYGYHVMKLESKKETFEEGKEAAKSGLLSKKYSEQMDKWKKEPRFKPVKNDKVINSIKV